MYLAFLTQNTISVKCFSCFTKHFQRECLTAFSAYLCRNLAFIFGRIISFPAWHSFLQITAVLVISRTEFFLVPMPIMKAVSTAVHSYLLSPFPSITPRCFLDASLSRLPQPTSLSDHPITSHNPLACHIMSPASFFSSASSSSLCSAVTP